MSIMIEFKSFEFLSWGKATSINKRYNIYTWDFTGYEVFNGAMFAQILFGTKKIHAEYDRKTKIFPLTEQGYKEACKWLNDKKQELAESICG